MHTSCSQGPVVSPYHLATPGGWHRKWHRQTAQAAVGLPTDPFSQGLWLGDAVFNSSEQLPYTFPESESYLCQERLFGTSYSIIARSKVHWLLLCNSPRKHAKAHMLLKASVIRAWELQSRQSTWSLLHTISYLWSTMEAHRTSQSPHEIKMPAPGCLRADVTLVRKRRWQDWMLFQRFQCEETQKGQTPLLMPRTSPRGRW